MNYMNILEEWKTRHNITVKDGIAKVDGDDTRGEGSTDELALLDWAEKKGIPSYHEEYVGSIYGLIDQLTKKHKPQR